LRSPISFAKASMVATSQPVMPDAQAGVRSRTWAARLLRCVRYQPDTPRTRGDRATPHISDAPHIIAGQIIRDRRARHETGNASPAQASAPSVPGRIRTGRSAWAIVPFMYTSTAAILAPRSLRARVAWVHHVDLGIHRIVPQITIRSDLDILARIGTGDLADPRPQSRYRPG